MSMKKISEAILGVGVDDTTIDLFESQYPVPTGVSYNSYVILDEKTTILDTVDARAMKERLEGKYLIDGPLALDNAIDKAAAKHKGIGGPVAGDADILIVPDLWSGNIFTKGLVFFAHMKSAGTLNGLRSPVVMTSRTDTIENKYYSILTSVLGTIQ